MINKYGNRRLFLPDFKILLNFISFMLYFFFPKFSTNSVAFFDTEMKTSFSIPAIKVTNVVYAKKLAYAFQQMPYVSAYILNLLKTNNMVSTRYAEIVNIHLLALLTNCQHMRLTYICWKKFCVYTIC